MRFHLNCFLTHFVTINILGCKLVNWSCLLRISCSSHAWKTKIGRLSVDQYQQLPDSGTRSRLFTRAAHSSSSTLCDWPRPAQIDKLNFLNQDLSAMPRYSFKSNFTNIELKCQLSTDILKDLHLQFHCVEVMYITYYTFISLSPVYSSYVSCLIVQDIWYLPWDLNGIFYLSHWKQPEYDDELSWWKPYSWREAFKYYFNKLQIL